MSPFWPRWSEGCCDPIPGSDRRSGCGRRLGMSRPASTYENAVDKFLKQSTNPAAKRAFDKRLAQIAADSPGIMRSNPWRRA
jgi:hypothetical protein